MSDSPDDGRNETPETRADRNWNELTQELRVSQTGVQILTGFLLILPFQARFADLTPGEVTTYLVLMSLAILTTILFVAPVSLHRFLFQEGRKIEVVQIANRITGIALVTLALLIVGTVWFVFELVASGPAAVIAPLVTVVILVSMWLVLPARQLSRHRQGAGRSDED